MTLRVGIDMDGTLADLSAAYRDLERALFGDRGAPVSDDAEIEEGEQEQAADGARALKAARRQARQRDLVWHAIRKTEDFWVGLQPLEPGVVRRLYEASITYSWEVSFITQRPSTIGQSVQRQTQQWLMREGFETPSVLTLAGGRGKVAAALELDVLLDDYPKNCVDVLSESNLRCRPILVLSKPSPSAEAVAKDLRIGVVRSVAEAIALLQTPPALSRPGAIQRIMEGLGFGARALSL